jgi:hypothetical protein
MKLPRPPVPAKLDGLDIVETLEGELKGFVIYARGTRGYTVALRISSTEARGLAERFAKALPVGLTIDDPDLAEDRRAIREFGGG